MVDDLIKVSFSQLASWNRCQYQWATRYIDEWTPVEIKSHLKVGTLGHEALSYYYKELKALESHKNAMEAAKNFILQQTVDEYEMQTIAFIGQVIARYPDFAREQDKKFTILEVETPFEIRLVSPNGIEYILEGIVDLVTRDISTGKIWIIDHKVTSRFWTPLEITTDMQLPIYFIAMAHRYQERPGMIMVNQIKSYPYKRYATEPLDKLFYRDRDSRTQAELYNTLDIVGRTVEKIHQWRMNGEPAIRNLTRDCPKCDFYDPCISEFKGHGREGFLGYTYRKRDRKLHLPMFDPVESAELDNMGGFG